MAAGKHIVDVAIELRGKPTGAQQLQVDLQHVENGLLGYRSNNLTPPAEMLMLRQQRDQELNRKLLHVGFLESEISSLQYKLQSMRATKHY